MILTQAIVKELLDYDPASGKLTWKERDVKWFKDNYRICNSWNTRYAGKEAFISKDINRYLIGKIFHISYRASRIIWLWMTGEEPNEIEHDNRIRSDNRWINLRNTDRITNNRNRGLPKNNKTGVLGVRFRSKTKKYESQITIRRKQLHLGTFDTLAEAALARKQANMKYGFHERHGI